MDRSNIGGGKKPFIMVVCLGLQRRLKRFYCLEILRRGLCGGLWGGGGIGSGGMKRGNREGKNEF